MKNITDWLVLIFIIMFWVFRFIVTFASETSGDFGGFIVFDKTIEIVLLFITVLSSALISRKSILGAILYLSTYGYYFGGYILNNINNFSDFSVGQNVLISIIAVLLAFFSLLNIIIGKMSKKGHTNSKTSWFFDNKETDRKLDDRADKNQYKIY